MTQVKSKDPRKLRNLRQYKDMTDEEFMEVIEGIHAKDSFYEDFDAKVSAKYEEFENDYDLSDMKFNDTETLRALCQAFVTLEDYEEIVVTLRSEGMVGMNLTIIKELSKVMSDLRKDISKMQEDLKITRKIRQATQEESAREELKRLKTLAAKFYEKVSAYVYCSKCNMLLATVWFLNFFSDNEVSLVCPRCSETTKVTSEQLMKKRGTNHPEGFKY